MWTQAESSPSVESLPGRHQPCRHRLNRITHMRVREGNLALQGRVVDGGRAPHHRGCADLESYRTWAVYRKPDEAHQQTGRHERQCERDLPKVLIEHEELPGNNVRQATSAPAESEGNGLSLLHAESTHRTRSWLCRELHRPSQVRGAPHWAHTTTNELSFPRVPSRVHRRCRVTAAR